jgi:hypothetical protein
VQAPFAARVDEAVGDQGLQDVQPARTLAAGWQTRLPEGVQLQLFPQFAGQPAGAPLPRVAQLQPTQLDLDDLAGQLRSRPVFREQGHLRRGGAVLVEDRDGAAPGRLLGIVDLAEVEHLALHHPPVGHPAILHHAPVAVLLAVLLTRLGSQEHADSVSKSARPFNDHGRHYKRPRREVPRSITNLQRDRRLKPPKNGHGSRRIVEVGLV